MSVQRESGLVRVLSPLHHGSDESSGIDNTLRRVKHVIPGEGATEIPAISGNTIRHALRDTLATHLLKEVGLYENGSLPLSVYYVMYSGGALKKGASTRFVEVASRRDVRETIPHLSLLGTSLKGGMMQGKVQVGQAIPYTERTRGIAHPPVDHDGPLLDTYHEALDWYYQTRAKDGEREDLSPVDEDASPQQMKYQYEVLAPGALLHHWWALDTESELEASCWAKAHALMRDGPTTLGGKEGVGFGQVDWPYDPDAIGPGPGVYEDYVQGSAEEISGFLTNELASLA